MRETQYSAVRESYGSETNMTNCSCIMGFTSSHVPLYHLSCADQYNSLGGGPENVFCSYQRISQRAIRQPSLEKQLDPLVQLLP